MSEKDKKVLENIQKELDRINKKENKIYFFVIDTKGVPSGSLEYIYNLAVFAKEEGYDVIMLHKTINFRTKEFCTVPRSTVYTRACATEDSLCRTRHIPTLLDGIENV